MVKPRIKIKDTKRDVVHDDHDMDYTNEYPTRITTNELRKEWDSSGEFADMDFRLVDDD